MLRVGDPEQFLRVMISTAGQATVLVASEGCPPGRPGTTAIPKCEDARGGIFTSSNSSTWKTSSAGNYTLGLEENLGYKDTYATFGLDSVALGPSEALGGPALESQTVAELATDRFYLGSFGLNHQPVNLSDPSNPQQSYLSTLKNQSRIPSLSWSYSAGARYSKWEIYAQNRSLTFKGLKGVFGSLTLGGYDSERFLPNNVTFHLATDISRDIVVSVPSIVIMNQSASVNAISSPILSFIDSTLPFIYLPLEACQEFERFLGLTWNDTWKTYYIDDNLHESLLTSNPNFTFRIADTTSPGPTADIVLPYASFDLNASFPFVPADTRYFPLKRAANDTQYTLGRTFLQEAYLSVNYEYSNFSVSQSKFNLDDSHNIIAFPPKTDRPNLVSHHRKQPLNTGGIIGGSIGAGVLVILVVAFLILWIRKKKRKSKPMEVERNKSVSDPSSLQAATISPMNEIGRKETPEILDTGRMLELLDTETPSGSGNVIHELPSPVATRKRELRSCSWSDEPPRGRSQGRQRLRPIELPATITSAKREARRIAAWNYGSEIRGLTIRPSRDLRNVDLDRSLPPTPVSESPQLSPIMPKRHGPCLIKKSFEALMTSTEQEVMDVMSIIECYLSD
ncbi:uncharacterized protein KY384_007925 [Bacidia gigantensis]|uniref:uncharacterized protein n=1 Tax=Bacidia gigantensis TaxID=2732470 RepID=UPI001D047DEF|nr:uncharacterized protein KY384_007925 [Bacidia gigantensis]KAG8527771.1 hypothetical protein KY384_007925 [Bacidia gigantensis]